MSNFATITPSAMDRVRFVETFKDIFEHSPWVAEMTFDQGIHPQHDQINQLHQSMVEQLNQSSEQQKLALINAHPDLAGKAAKQGTLTASSSDEQNSAGINQCTAEEFARFQTLNTDYKEKFGFPFIMAVKGQNRHLILDAFSHRINNSYQTEFDQALIEITKIALIRLNQL